MDKIVQGGLDWKTGGSTGLLLISRPTVNEINPKHYNQWRTTANQSQSREPQKNTQKRLIHQNNFLQHYYLNVQYLS